MRTIIAGSRKFQDYYLLAATIAKLPWSPTVVLCGCASGADTLGERWAWDNHVPVEKYPADWSRNGNSAGPIRNQQMCEVAEALVAFPAPDSIGTRDMIRRAAKDGLRVHVEEIQNETLDGRSGNPFQHRE